LPNGWLYRISVSDARDYNNISWEGVGILILEGICKHLKIWITLLENQVTKIYLIFVTLSDLKMIKNMNIIID